jgi:hypothetical protein
MGRIDMELWTPFIKQWEEAASACLSPDEFAELIGVHVGTLRSRQIALRDRGIMLPLLAGQRGPIGPRGKAKKVEKSESDGAATNRIAKMLEATVIYVM